MKLASNLTLVTPQTPSHAQEQDSADLNKPKSPTSSLLTKRSHRLMSAHCKKSKAAVGHSKSSCLPKLDPTSSAVEVAQTPALRTRKPHLKNTRLRPRNAETGLSSLSPPAQDSSLSAMYNKRSLRQQKSRKGHGSRE